MISELPKTSVAEILAEKIVALKPGALPATTTRKCEDLLIDVVGLCVTARNQDYIESALDGWDDDGPLHGDRPSAHADGLGGSLRQRHRGAWRGISTIRSRAARCMPVR